MERELAYGFSMSKVSATGFTLQLMAFKQREIRVENSGGVYRARVLISGKAATLNRIFVFADEGLLLPRVRYVELRGTTESGGAITERIVAP